MEETKEEILNTQEIEQSNETQGESYFDGDPWVFFFLKLGLFLLKVVTLWIAQPYCEVVKNRYELSHTVIDGRRLAFTGTAAGIWGVNMLWNVLTVISAFICFIFKFMKMKVWIVRHTVFEDTGEVVEDDKEDENEEKEKLNSKFSGSIKEWTKVAFKSFFVTIFSLFLLTPLAIYWVETYSKNNTFISGKRLTLNISFKEFWNKWIRWILLSIVTLGVYLIFLNVKTRRYLVKFTHIAKEE